MQIKKHYICDCPEGWIIPRGIECENCHYIHRHKKNKKPREIIEVKCHICGDVMERNCSHPRATCSYCARKIKNEYDRKRYREIAALDNFAYKA